MLYAFSYILKEVNVIIPFNTFLINIPEQNKEEIYFYVTNLTLKKVSSFKDLAINLKKLKVKFNYFELGKFEIEKYGLESAYYRNIRNLSYLDNLTVSNCNPNLSKFTSDIIYIEDFINVPELKIGYIYSKYFREFFLKRLALKYSELKIDKHKGKLTKEHENIILNLKVLPNFYNESFLINYFLKKNIIPNWAHNYIKNNYEQLIK